MAEQNIFDTRSPEEILAQRARDRQAQVQKTIDSLGIRSPADKTAALAGGMLGTALANRFFPEKLTPDEERRTSAIQAAKEQTNAWRAQNPNADVAELGLQQQRYLAENLMKVGDEAGIGIAQNWIQAMQARKKADLEMRKLEGEDIENRAQARNLAAEAQSRENDLARGKIGSIWINGEDQYGSLGHTAFIDPVTGEAVMKMPDGNVRRVPGYSYTGHPPQKPGSLGDSLRDFGVPPSEGTYVRKEAGGILKEIDGAMNLRNILAENVKDGDGSVNFLGKAGETQTWVRNAADTLGGLWRAAVADGRKDNVYQGVAGGKDLTNSDNAMKYLRDNPDLQKTLDQYVPSNFRKGTRAYEMWQSQMIQLTYAVGMAAEPGSRQLSDSDFKNHAAELGGTSSDPEAFRRLLLNRVTRDITNFNDKLMFYGPKVVDLMLNPAGHRNFNKKFDEFSQTFNAGDWGTAQTPGPGLQGGAGNESDDEFLKRITGPQGQQ